MAVGGSRRAAAEAAIVALGLASLTIFAEGIGFTRLKNPSVENYRRQPNSLLASFDIAAKNLTKTGTYDRSEVSLRAEGSPGAAVFDIDGDGDLDIFVPSAPGQEHALFLNTLVPEGTFGLTTTCDGQSCASVFGLAFPELDGNGVCTADIDNDGDQDMVILNKNSPWQLLRNDGGKFAQISMEPQDIADGNGATTCTFGDVDGDGLVDLVVGFGFSFPVELEQFLQGTITQPKLLMNKGPGAALHFVNETNIRGFEGAQGNVTLSVSLVDYDQDGDVDLFTYDDRVMPLPKTDERGLVHLWKNDGSGNFELANGEASGLTDPGSNMGGAFADFNCDGNLDVYVTRSGSLQVSYFMRLNNLTEEQVLEMVRSEGRQIAFGSDNGTIEIVDPLDPSGNKLRPPFGWGVLAEDFDNDGDADVAFVGASLMDSAMILSPGVVLENSECTGMFKRSSALIDQEFERSVMSTIAAGDLNDDGFMDFVAVAGVSFPENASLTLLNSVEPEYVLEEVKGSPFLNDTIAYFAFMDPDFKPSWGGPLDEEGNPVFAEKGILAVEMNDANSGNNWVKVKLRGSIGDVEGAKVNRDGTGAIINFTPDGGRTSIVPQTNGVTHGSSDNTKIFGLESKTEGQLVVMWPGKIFNVLKVFATETVVMPEIPCSAYNFSGDDGDFLQCLGDSLATLQQKGIIDNQMHNRLFTSMTEAYNAPKL